MGRIDEKGRIIKGRATNDSKNLNGFHLLDYFKPPEDFDYGRFNYRDAGGTKYDEFIGNYISLSENHSDVLTYQQRGTDESGFHPLYEFHFKPEDKYGETATDLPKILFTVGVHGEEKSSTFSFYYFIEQLLERWDENETLEYLRWNVEIVFQPVVNPSGFNSNHRVNSNGIDINRNFNLNHSSEGAGGPSPFSENETLAVKKMIDDNPDAIYFCDYHTNGTSGDDYDLLMWFINTTDDYAQDKVDAASEKMINLTRRKWVARYDLSNNEGYFGRVTTTNAAMCHSYAIESGITGNLIECYRKLPAYEEYHGALTMKGCTEYIVNWILLILKELH